MPRRAQIGSEADLTFLQAVEGVTAVEPPDEAHRHWRVTLKEGADGRVLLKACFEHGVVPEYFDVNPPSLHDVFVAVVEKAP